MKSHCRDAVAEDRPFLDGLDDSLFPWIDAVAGLSEGQRHALLAMQRQARDRSYAARWPDARCRIVECDGPAGRVAVGRIWTAVAGTSLHLLDISLLPGWRGQGLGGELLLQLVAEAGAGGRGVTLEVLEDNPARRLYRRIGFELVERQSPYLRMHRPAGLPQAALPAARVCALRS